MHSHCYVFRTDKAYLNAFPSAYSRTDTPGRTILCAREQLVTRQCRIIASLHTTCTMPTVRDEQRGIHTHTHILLCKYPYSIYIYIYIYIYTHTHTYIHKHTGCVKRRGVCRKVFREKEERAERSKRGEGAKRSQRGQGAERGQGA